MVSDGPNVEIVKKVATAVKDLKKVGHQVFIVVGGGATARKYIEKAWKLRFSKAELDELGIAATRLNAKLLSLALDEPVGVEVPKTVEAAAGMALEGRIPVMGGTVPGHTTDTVAVMLANVSASELLVFITDVDGIYTADPKKHPEAKKIPRLSTKELLKMFGRIKQEPGMKVVIDPVAVKLIDRYKIKTLVLPASELERLVQIVGGAEHSGTTVEPVG